MYLVRSFLYSFRILSCSLYDIFSGSFFNMRYRLLFRRTVFHYQNMDYSFLWLSKRSDQIIWSTSLLVEPTGLLVDAAMKLVFDVISEVSIHERRDALLRASRHALMRGVTTVVDVGSYFPGKSEKQVWQDFTGILYHLLYIAILRNATQIWNILRVYILTTWQYEIFVFSPKKKIVVGAKTCIVLHKSQ